MTGRIKQGAMPLSVKDMQAEATAKLKACGIENSAKDVRLLFASILRCEPGAILTMGERALSEPEITAFYAAIAQRMDGRPVHRIIGSREFYGRHFTFDEHCLEPRPETELLVERILEDHDKNATCRFAEVGVGSGVIAVTLLSELENARALATDISPGALAATKANAHTYDVGSRLDLVETDCLSGVEEKFDFIVSNPPYIETAEVSSLSREVREHDPLQALDGGEDGLDIYRRLLDQARSRLVDRGRLYLETGHGQHAALCDLAIQNGWGIVSCHLDLSGLQRIVVFEARLK